MIRWLPFGRRRRLEKTFAISTALLVGVLMGTTMLVVHWRVALSLRQGLEDRGLSIARSIGAVSTPSLFAYNYAALQLAAERASEDTGASYVVIHDKEGDVAGVAGSVRAPEVEASPSLAPDAAPTSYDLEVATTEGGREKVLEVAVPVRVEGVEEAWGVVRVGLSYEPVRAELQSIGLGLLGLGLALALGAVASGRYVARRITAPLRRLAEGTEAFAAGAMDHRIPVTGAKELADLAAAFNLMTGRVQEKALESSKLQKDLERLNATLEEQVNQRTRELAESEDQYKAIVEHSPDAILIVQEGRVRFVNPAFVETFGIDEEEALSESFRLEALFEHSAEALARGRIAAWERGESARPTEVLGKKASGRILQLELRGSQIEYRGRPAAECLLIDMSEAKRLRERLAETEKMRALGELAGGVAHDFNNLLGAILGRVQLLRRRGFDSQVDAELGVVEKAARDGRETVRRIQEFSRTRRGGKRGREDLGEILRDAMEITRTRWKSEAERRNVAIDVKLDAREVPPVEGNAAELREVFTNLILNAIDAMPQGGHLRLSCWCEGAEVLARVEDTGVGMTEEIRRQLFDPFFTTKGHAGMGLGMSVVYGIVTRHGGRIEVETALGKGTAFLLRLPAASADAVADEAAEGVSGMAARRGRILVIDDESNIAEVLRDTLSAEGHAVEMALCGNDGVQLATLGSYDLVFTDLGMPDLSGWEVARRIRQRTPEMPVVLVTGWGATLDENEIQRCGVSAVVHKPFELDDVVQTTLEVLAETGRGEVIEAPEPDLLPH